MKKIIITSVLFLTALTCSSQRTESYNDSILYDSIYTYSDQHLMMKKTFRRHHYVDYILWNDTVYVFESKETWCCWFRGRLRKTLTREEFSKKYFDISNL